MYQKKGGSPVSAENKTIIQDSGQPIGVAPATGRIGTTIFEQAKIQAQVLIPLLRAFQDELGEERANEIARKALRSYGHKLGQKMRSQLKGNSMEKLAAFVSMCASGDAQDHEVLKQTPETLEINVTRCLYAEHYKKLDALDLGFLCVCEPDFPMAESFVPDVEYTRTQTIMQGASYCDHRYRMKK